MMAMLPPAWEKTGWAVGHWCSELWASAGRLCSLRCEPGSAITSREIWGLLMSLKLSFFLCKMTLGWGVFHAYAGQTVHVKCLAHQAAGPQVFCSTDPAGTLDGDCGFHLVLTPALAAPPPQLSHPEETLHFRESPFPRRILVGGTALEITPTGRLHFLLVFLR